MLWNYAGNPKIKSNEMLWKTLLGLTQHSYASYFSSAPRTSSMVLFIPLTETQCCSGAFYCCSGSQQGWIPPQLQGSNHDCLSHWFSDFGVYQNHLEDLLKRIAGLHSWDFSFTRFWVRFENLYFSYVSRWCYGYWSISGTLRIC